MEKIIVVGNEDFTLGFELIGIESYPLVKLENLLNSKDIGIVVILREDFDSLPIKIQNRISKLIKPIIVILSNEDIKGNILKEKIIKAMGVDLLK